VRLARRDIESLSLSVGGVALAVGVILLLVHQGGGKDWTTFERFIVVDAPASLLFVLALAGVRRGAERAEPWRSVLLVVSILLSLLALFLFLEWIGADTKHLLYDAAVLVLTAAIAWFGAQRARSPYAILLAALALLVAWLLVWIKILDHPSGDTVRWVIVAGGALLLVAARGLGGAGALGAREVATIGGLGLVAAGVFGVFVGSVELFGRLFFEGAGVVPPFPGLRHLSGAQTPGWDAFLAVAVGALIWLGARTATRGLGYVGALGLVLFVASTGAQLTRVESGHAPSSSLWGWPLGLVIAGLVALLVPVLLRARDGRAGA